LLSPLLKEGRRTPTEEGALDGPLQVFANSVGRLGSGAAEVRSSQALLLSLVIGLVKVEIELVSRDTPPMTDLDADPQNRIGKLVVASVLGGDGRSNDPATTLGSVGQVDVSTCARRVDVAEAKARKARIFWVVTTGNTEPKSAVREVVFVRVELRVDVEAPETPGVVAAYRPVGEGDPQI
jgi:hypothetical protein